MNYSTIRRSLQIVDRRSVDRHVRKTIINRKRFSRFIVFKLLRRRLDRRPPKPTVSDRFLPNDSRRRRRHVVCLRARLCSVFNNNNVTIFQYVSAPEGPRPWRIFLFSPRCTITLMRLGRVAYRRVRIYIRVRSSVSAGRHDARAL